ncbi:MAG: ABC transporter ATP-binding protein [Acidimicrobiales bacterium]
MKRVLSRRAANGRAGSGSGARKEVVRRFLPFLRPVRPLVVSALGASVVTAVMQWLSPWPLKVIFDSVLLHHRLPAVLSFLPPSGSARLLLLSAGMLLIAAVLAGATYAGNRWVTIAGQTMVNDIRCALFAHIEDQSLRFHYSRKTGDLMSRLGGDSQAIQSLMVTALPTVLNGALTIVGMLVIMLLLDWRFTLLALAMTPALFLLVRYHMPRIKAAQRRARRHEGAAASVAQEVLTSMPVVQSHCSEQIESARYAEAVGKSMQASQEAQVLQSALTPTVALIVTVGTTFAVYVGARAVISGQLTPGDLLVFTSYLRSIYAPVRQLAKIGGVVGRAQAAAERVAEVLDTAEEVPVPAGARPVRRARGRVTLEGVSFSYPGCPGVLHSVDLEVPARSRQALVGATGSGKSTLLKLLPRLFDPTAGTVLLDGVDISTLQLTGLRNAVSFVPQEPYLFNATVWENIAYGTYGTRLATAVEAAKRAGVHEVIESLHDGYKTVVSERGTSLSGGQRQCLALARAMLRGSPLLLLDEPTVGLDAQTESVVLAALDNLAEGRTTIMVSHDLSTLSNSDQIAVLASGTISELGTHEELLGARCGYWKLDSLQSRRSPAPREVAI